MSATARPASPVAATPRGRIVWYENLTLNAKKAVDFYSKLVGWKVDVMDNGQQLYYMLSQGDTQVAGVLDMPEDAKKMGTPPQWMMYVGVPDVDAAVKQAQGLGAKVYVQPRDIPNMGRFAVLADPQGAGLALWTAAQPAGDEPHAGQPGEFSWHELLTSDPDAGWTFYQKMFGWEKRDAHDMGPMGTYQLWSRPGWPFPLGGLMQKPKEVPVSSWVLYIRVKDLDKAVADAKKLGGQIVNGPMEVPGGDKIAQGLDPNGAHFSLHWTAK